jgi:hypothetical protein
MLRARKVPCGSWPSFGVGYMNEDYPPMNLPCRKLFLSHLICRTLISRHMTGGLPGIPSRHPTKSVLLRNDSTRRCSCRIAVQRTGIYAYYLQPPGCFDHLSIEATERPPRPRQRPLRPQLQDTCTPPAYTPELIFAMRNCTGTARDAGADLGRPALTRSGACRSAMLNGVSFCSEGPVLAGPVSRSPR